jgi:dipeptidase D
MTHHRDESLFYEKIYPHFQKICKLRRPSGEESEITEFIKNYAQKIPLLLVESDTSGNILVHRPATKGLEHLPPLMFQGHLDMVCVPDKNIFPIRPAITNGWVHTEGTTLGADNGIAVAIMMELMRYPFEKCLPLEFLFTTSEEIGLKGAGSIDSNKLQSRADKLVNVDSEEIDYITIGCAGGRDIDIFTEISYQPNQFKNAFSVTVTGPGGHSGILIHERIPNAIKVVSEGLLKASENNDSAISVLSGGLAYNAIPATANIIISSNSLSNVLLEVVFKEISKKYSDYKPFSVTIENKETPHRIFKQENTQKILRLLTELPHGVLKMNPETKGVLSSINLAMMSVSDTTVKIAMNTRSSDELEIENNLNRVESLCKKYPDTTTNKLEGYLGWRPNVNSDLLRVATSSFEKVHGKKPQYLDIHAGLECGILMNKFSGIKEAISIGPNLLDVHSVKERLEIASTVEIWDIILELINCYSS